MKKTSSDISTQQQERLHKIGAHLQQIRVAKGWSLALSARKTKIRTTILRNIEMGELEGLPEPVYLQGLIRHYAEGLGLNGLAIANSFPIEQFPQHWKLPIWQQWSCQFQLRPVHLYMVYVFMIVTTVQSLSSVIQTSSTRLSPELDPALQQQSTVSTPVAPTQPAATLVNNKPEIPALTDSDSVLIDIRTEEAAWMQVVIDGEIAFEGTLPEGTQKQWVVDESIKIRTGNAGAVVITINDEQPHPLGEPGAVEEFTYQALLQEESVEDQAPS
jgi:cytoskeletal protein RodZ